MNDQQHLQDYVLTGSHGAFRLLVDRYLGLVYSAALRMVHDAPRAEGIAHRVFAALAKNADAIGPGEPVARWLYDATRREAVRDTLTARQRSDGGRTQIADAPATEAQRVTDNLEAMMDRLPAKDRDAIVLRFLAQRGGPELAGFLQVTEEAAQARVNHAVEMLQTEFNKAGTPITSAVLTEMLTSECAAHVPIGLAIAVGAEALEAAATAPARRTAANWWENKAVALVVVAGFLVGAGIFIRQYARLGELKSENQRLLAERKKFRSDFAAGRTPPARDGSTELVRLRRSEDELLRLRRELTQLRAEIPAAPPPGPAAPTPPVPPPADEHEPGRLITSEALRFSGYTTPAAAMESVVWSMVVGGYDAYLIALSPEDRTEELNHPEGREFFEARQQELASQFKAMQVFALKVLSDDEVELKVLLDFGTPIFQIQPLVRINEQWRLSDSTHEYSADWDNTGDVRLVTPAR
jgi:RNA polymerase sigma-70 factor (ECF subfamily)